MKLVFCFLGFLVMGCFGHPCPYLWNIGFAEERVIRGEGFEGFCEAFNKAVAEETGGEVKRAIVYSGGDSFRMDDPSGKYGDEMARLVLRYKRFVGPDSERFGDDEGEVVGRFSAEFPVACVLTERVIGASSLSFSEEVGGFFVCRGRRLWCRAYGLGEDFLRVVGDEDGGRLFVERVGFKPEKLLIGGEKVEVGIENYVGFLEEMGVVLVLATEAEHLALEGEAARLKLLAVGETAQEKRFAAARVFLGALAKGDVGTAEGMVALPFSGGGEYLREKGEGVRKELVKLGLEIGNVDGVEFEEDVSGVFGRRYVGVEFELVNGKRGTLSMRDDGGRWVVMGCWMKGG